MLRFILILLIILVLFKVSQTNPQMGFGIYLLLAIGFTIYTIDTVDKEDVEHERNLLRSTKQRRLFFQTINSK